ncbi:MAG: UbiD family decarboxylase, partial [Mariprofundaceae bacterium]|nr:UbiD family decarboxylase [Mariprofundaceae bacterium]
MNFPDMRSFLAELEKRGLLKRIDAEVSPELEVTAISRQVLEAGGPALLFENVKGHDMPMLTNLFATPERIALGMGLASAEGLRDIGELLASLKEPEPPKGMKDAWDKLPMYRKVLHMAPKVVKKAPWQEISLRGDEVDL